MRRILSCLAIFAAGAVAGPQDYTLSTIAGGIPAPTPITATQASIGQPQGLALDAAGNLYLSSDNCVFRLDPNGVLTRVAGTGVPGYSGDGGPALQGQLNSPRGLAVDAAGNLYIADYSNRVVRKVTPAGLITTVAGGGRCTLTSNVPPSCDLGNGRPATGTQLDAPVGVAVDAQGNLYFSDVNTIRKVDSAGIITTAVYSPTFDPQYIGISLDAAGNLYAATFDQYIVKVSPDGTSTRIASGLPAHTTLFPHNVALDSSGNLYFSDGCCIQKLGPDGTSTTVAGNSMAGYSGDAGPAGQAQLSAPWGMAFDPSGNLYIADTGNLRVRKVSKSGIIATVAGNGTLSDSGDGGPARDAQTAPVAITMDTGRNLYFTDSSNVIRKIDTRGVITTVAGTGQSGYSGDGGPATSAQLWQPGPITVDAEGNLYFLDVGNYRIRKVSAAGAISTIAGTGQSGYSGDGPAAATPIAMPTGIAVDSTGNVYYTEFAGLVRKVGLDGMVTTVAGNYKGTYVEGGPAASARLQPLVSLAVDRTDNLYFVERLDNRFAEIHKVTPAGTITTIAGGLVSRMTPGVLASNVYLPYYPLGLAVDRLGNLYFGYLCNVQKVVTDGAVIPVGVQSACGLYYGDGDPGANGLALGPLSFAVDPIGNIFFTDRPLESDSSSGSIRMFQPPDSPLLNVAAAEPRGVERGRHSFALLVNNGAPMRSTAGIVTVTETPPDGTVLISMTGPGWTCENNSCRRSDPLVAGATYPPIDVIVAGTPKPAAYYNQAAVWGGGSPEFSASEALHFAGVRSPYQHPKPKR